MHRTSNTACRYLLVCVCVFGFKCSSLLDRCSKFLLQPLFITTPTPPCLSCLGALCMFQTHIHALINDQLDSRYWLSRGMKRPNVVVLPLRRQVPTNTWMWARVEYLLVIDLPYPYVTVWACLGWTYIIKCICFRTPQVLSLVASAIREASTQLSLRHFRSHMGGTRAMFNIHMHRHTQMRSAVSPWDWADVFVAALDERCLRRLSLQRVCWWHLSLSFSQLYVYLSYSLKQGHSLFFFLFC